MTLWTDVFAQQIHHYSFPKEKSNNDTKKIQQGKKNHTEWLGTLWRKGENQNSNEQNF